MELTLIDLAAQMAELKQRVSNIEAAHDACATGPRPDSTATKWPSAQPKKHPATVRAEARHAPPLTSEEIEQWCARIPVGRRFKKHFLAQKYWSGKKDGPAMALRVCYWLRAAGILDFDQSSFEYHRPVPERAPET